MIIFVSACGYTPIFSKKIVNFNIENIEFIGNKSIKESIVNALSNYQNKPGKEKKISLILHSAKNKTAVSKNIKGEPQVYKVSIQVKMKVILSENSSFEKALEESATFSVVERKSDEELIEDNLVKDLSSQIAQQIILELLEKTK